MVVGCSRSARERYIVAFFLASEALFYAIEKISTDIEVKLVIEFADAGWAGNIDFGDIIANDIDADEYQFPSA